MSRRGSLILIADDNQDQTDSLAALFELTGHTVLRAYTGQHALELAEAFRPLWMILDLSMPLMSGQELAKTIRRLSWGQSARLLALSGYGNAKEVESALQAGFDHHFIKPVEFAQLIAVMRE